MKLVHFNLSATTDLHTGIGVYANEIMKRMPGNGPFEYEAGFNSLLRRRTKNSSACSYGFPVRYSRVPGRMVFDERYSGMIPLTYARMLGSRADVFVFWGNRMPHLRVGGKTLAFIHDITPVHLAADHPEAAAEFNGNIRNILNRADQIATVSNHSRKEIAECFGYDIGRIRVIYNGVDFEHFNRPITDEERNAIRGKYKLPERYILYFGNARRFKNAEGVVRAYAMLPSGIHKEYDLVVANSSPYLTELVRDLDLANHVTLLNGVDAVDKAGLYQMATLKLFLSRYEGFGIPVIEAMAAGVPVIASNTSAMPEVCGGAAELADYSDMEAIAWSMENIIENDSLRAAMIKKGYQNARKYSWDNSAKELTEVLESII